MTQHCKTQEEFVQEVEKFQGVVLVDFYADRCGPCKMLSPIIDELAQQYTDTQTVKIIKIDVDENPDTAGAYGVMSIPTTIIFKNGEIQHQDVGVQMKEVYENKINALL